MPLILIFIISSNNYCITEYTSVNGENIIDVFDESGNIIATIIVNEQGILQVSVGTQTSNSAVSSVLDINLYDNFGNLIQPKNDISICLKSDDGTKGDESCLGYFNEIKNKWECEDYCLKEKSNNFLCGETDHLTNFAVLFSGTGRNGKCVSDTIDYTIIYLSIAFAALMLLFIIFILIASYTKIGTKLLFGNESYRVYQLRNSTASLQPTVVNN